MKDIISFDVSDEVIDQAKEIRAKRDKEFANIFTEVSTDMRWVGEIGEIIVNQAFNMCRPEATEWITDNVTKRGDFSFCDLEIEVKTVKRKVPVRPHYKAQITASHRSKPVDYILFTCYEFPVKKLHILGVMSRDKFLAKAERFNEGDKVHANYTIRKGHAIDAVTISDMDPFRDLLRTAMRAYSQVVV